MTPLHRAQFLAHAEAQCPREACAVLFIENGNLRIKLCQNIADERDQFIINPIDYADAARRGEVVGIVHSHCYVPAIPSEADRVGCEATGVEWHILSVPNGVWHSFKPSGYRAPLIGRAWAHGSLDCFGLIRDYYQEKLGIQIRDFERRPEWWEKGDDLYCPGNIKLAGFSPVDMSDVREHDILLMQVHSKVINHGGIYLGGDMFLHHLHARLSSRDIFAGYWRKHTVKVVRYDENR